MGGYDEGELRERGQVSGFREQGTGNRELGTGNEEQGTGSPFSAAQQTCR